MIKVSKKVLNEYKRWIENAIFLIEDNPKIKTKDSFYCAEDILYNLNLMLNDINEVLK
jgi:hypothetical protein